MKIAWMLLFLIALPASAVEGGVRIKDLGRIDGARENSLVGYGLVTGLAGTGDSLRSRATLQSVANTLVSFGIYLTPEEVNSRNVAAVMLTTSLPAFAQPGDKLDVNISSLGDARSLSGGTLLMAPLLGPDKKIYALAQGPVSVGGFKYDLYGNVVQKNHPTSGNIPGGGMVEKSVSVALVKPDGTVDFVLHEPDFTTASRITESVNATFGNSLAKAISAGRVQVRVPDPEKSDIVAFITRLENAEVVPDQRARVVVNERTGTVVSGGDVKISMVTVSYGELRVSIATDYMVSQPTMLIEPGPNVRTEVVPRTRIDVKEKAPSNSVSLPTGTTVSDLVAALNLIKASTRDIINILQGIKKAGALHAELVIQ